MCGIVAYVGNQNAIPIIIQGLKRLEYRGYDSTGIAYIKNNKLILNKKACKVNGLSESIGKKLKSNIGIGHTRWATHGAPSDENAHPHLSNDGNLAIIHNGVIENYLTIKQGLQKKWVCKN